MDLPADTDVATLAALLRWHLEMGADWAVDERPHDRFAEFAAERAAAPAETAAAVRPSEALDAPARRTREIAAAPAAARGAAVGAAVGAVVGAAVGDVRERSLSLEATELGAGAIAAAALDLDALRAAYERFDGCALKRSATRLAFSDGAPDARLMLVGEAPGAEEDRTGRPFVGRAGQLLDRMLVAIGLDRTKVYIANVVPWRPPGNRTPTPQEVAICMPFLQRQIALVDPDILVALGGAAAQALFGLKDGIMRTRGVWRTYGVESAGGLKNIAALATLHPAYLLRTPAAKRLAWRDLREIRKELDGLPARAGSAPDP
jgi:uracil-DNA glycosylase